MEKDMSGVFREWGGFWLKYEDFVGKVEFNWSFVGRTILEKGRER